MFFKELWKKSISLQPGEMADSTCQKWVERKIHRLSEFGRGVYMAVLDNAKHTAERAAVSALADQLLKKINKAEDYQERSKLYVQIVDMVKNFIPDAKDDTLQKVRAYVSNPENRWMKVINHILDDADPHYAKGMLLNLGYESFFRGTKMIRESRKKYNCNIPWLILFDPTSACNMHCKGCWSGTYGHKSSLTYEEMDKIVTEGKELGTHLYMMTGGEPMVKKEEIFRLAKKHNDCFFALYSNSTLINEEVCRTVRDLGNISFFLSIEGTPETNDARRGAGHYAAVMKAMDLLHKYGIVFGTSICYTRDNIEAVTSDDFYNMLASKGAHYGFYFHLMPIGSNAVPELMPTPEQREYMIRRIREVRSEGSKVEFYPMDFQNDGEFVGGCIAGGRNYFHINSNGDAEPCVFIHFSNTNIRDNTILEMLQSPLFMAYHEGQPFNRNHLLPCPMLENPQLIVEMVHKTGAHQTNEESPEEVEDLVKKTIPYAENWKPVADRIWASENHKRPGYENYTLEKREHPELAAFEHADGTEHIDLSINAPEQANK